MGNSSPQPREERGILDREDDNSSFKCFLGSSRTGWLEEGKGTFMGQTTRSYCIVQGTISNIL